MGVGSRAGGGGGSGGAPANVLAQGEFTLAPIVLADGQIETLQLTQEGWLRVAEQQIPAAEDNVNNVYWVAQRATATATGAWTNSNPVALIGTAGITLKAAPGRMRRIRAFNTGAVAWFLQIHNKAAAPVNADNSIDRRLVPAGTDVEIDYGPEGVFCSIGVSYAISTAPLALTLIGALEAAIFAEFL